jgi:gamma-glutamyltranspeptidase / glutathione hydrolase
MDLADPPSVRPALLGRRHMVVAGHPLAAMAGMRVLEAGGNAIDAGVAAGFALNVLQPDMANLGGVAPIMIHRAVDRRITTFAGIGTWPRAATLKRVADAGNGRIQAGPGRWVVPAAPDAWLTALARYGTWSAADALAPAIELAERGYPLHYFLRHNLFHISRATFETAHTREVFLPGGRVPEIGAIVRQQSLAATLTWLVDAERKSGGSREDGIAAGRNAFYGGEIAQRIDSFAREIGAFITAEDLHAYHVAELPPVSVSYRGRIVHCCGPWSQGPALAQMLAIAEGFDLARMAAEQREHVLIETVKRALRDRNRFYGDPDFTEIPIARLLSPEHAAELRHGIRPDRVSAPGALPEAIGSPTPDTTYVCVVDEAGNAFSATPSDSTILVSPMVPDLGFGISDRGLQASLDPADPNAVAPGKRPRLTPNPALVTGADMLMPFGTPGGEVQTQAMLQFLVNHLDRGMGLQEAAEAPRWASFDVPATEDPHPSQPNMVRLESRAGPDLAAALWTAGHDVLPWPKFSALAGSICAIRRDAATGTLTGAADPRRMSYAIGW